MGASRIPRSRSARCSMIRIPRGTRPHANLGRCVAVSITKTHVLSICESERVGQPAAYLVLNAKRIQDVVDLTQIHPVDCDPRNNFFLYLHTCLSASIPELRHFLCLIRFI
jgi:hypothetical protein